MGVVGCGQRRLRGLSDVSLNPLLVLREQVATLRCNRVVQIGTTFLCHTLTVLIKTENVGAPGWLSQLSV